MKSMMKRFQSYTLLELLVVIAIFIILGAMGFGGYLSTRETMIARETVETIKQDIRSARLKAMLFKKGDDSNWIYGIGIDFEKYAQPTNNRSLFFKWCSPFEDFGNEITKSKILSWDSNNPVGYRITQNYDPLYQNGYLPLNTTTNCVDGKNSLVYTQEDIMSNILTEVDNIEIISDARYLVFEAITGRAFLYDNGGTLLNYATNGDYIGNTLDRVEVLDIVFNRDYSSKFDLISVYPVSGTVIHHVYSSLDPRCVEGGVNCIELNGVAYERYGIKGEINSYRE